MSLIKNSVAKLEDYRVVQTGARIKMNQNESPFNLDPEIKRKIGEEIIQKEWNRYPDGTASSLIRAIGRYTGHPESGILAGNGSNELILALACAVCRPGDRVLVVNPGFSVYKRAAALLDLQVSEVPLKSDFSYNTGAVLEAAEKCRLVYLASPHNPAGCVFPRKGWEQLIRSSSAVLAADEAYFEFSRETVQSLLDLSPRLILLRTLSKALGLAGLRIGYALGEEHLISGVRKACLPFSLGVVQQAAGAAFLEYSGAMEARSELIIRERDRLFHAMKRLPGIRPFPSRANFILFKTVREPGPALYEKLYSRGVLVRIFKQPELEDTLRVTVGLPEENEFFLSALKQSIGERQ